jgi:glycine cleavage system regulatory protein
MTGETHYHPHAWLRIPTDAAAEELRTALQKLAGEMMVELHLTDDAAS